MGQIFLGTSKVQLTKPKMFENYKFFQPTKKFKIRQKRQQKRQKRGTMLGKYKNILFLFQFKLIKYWFNKRIKNTENIDLLALYDHNLVMTKFGKMIDLIKIYQMAPKISFLAYLVYRAL